MGADSVIQPNSGSVIVAMMQNTKNARGVCVLRIEVDPLGHYSYANASIGSFWAALKAG